MKTTIVCFVAGKSGGHIIPCLTIAQLMRVHHKRASVLFFSSDTNLDKKILTHNSAISWHIMLPLSTKAQSLYKTIAHIIVSFVRSFFYLCKYRPTEIITTGGIVAIPTCIAGFLLRIPIIIYSLDAIPGKAIQFLAPLATSLSVCFESSQKYFPAGKSIVKPYPIKYSNDTINQHDALIKLHLNPHKKTIVILGGSQGSLFLNNCIKELIKNRLLNSEHYNIIHQTGSLDSTDWKHFYQENKSTAYVFSYMPDLEYVYSAADLIICRAGAGTLFEIKHFKKSCLIIPLETNTTTHQVDNAHAMSREYPELFFSMSQSVVEKNKTVLVEIINKMLFK